jgi:hypothetical protein
MSVSKPSRLFLLVVPVLLVGCAAPTGGMKMIPGAQVDLKPDPAKATVVIMRASGFAKNILSPVYEVRGDDERFIGILPVQKMIVYRADPGVTRFMVMGESVDFMDATLAAGKTYYAVVMPRMGVWKARFSILPVHAADVEKSLPGYKKDCSDMYVDNSEQSLAWAKDHAADAKNRKNDGLKDWLKQTDKATLLVGDGQ